jgi:hypothetical protein
LYIAIEQMPPKKATSAAIGASIPPPDMNEPIAPKRHKPNEA